MADTQQSGREVERRTLARTGLWVVLGVVAAMVLTAVVVLSHRAHTPTLTPGQKQPSSLALLVDRLRG